MFGHDFREDHEGNGAQAHRKKGDIGVGAEDCQSRHIQCEGDGVKDCCNSHANLVSRRGEEEGEGRREGKHERWEKGEEKHKSITIPRRSKNFRPTLSITTAESPVITKLNTPMDTVRYDAISGLVRLKMFVE